MLVNRITWIAKRGHKREVVEMLKSLWPAAIFSHPPDVVRVYLPRTGAYDLIATELEFENWEHYARYWSEMSAFNSGENAANVERFMQITETGGSHELWEVEAIRP